jgi:hypothetical protein
MNIYVPITVETEAEADNVFILEQLITKLTAKDPLANRLAQLNEYIESMQKQLMMKETAPEEYEKADTKLQEIETEFSKVMRAEDYYECNVHNRTKDHRAHRYQPTQWRD